MIIQILISSRCTASTPVLDANCLPGLPYPLGLVLFRVSLTAAVNQLRESQRLGAKKSPICLRRYPFLILRNVPKRYPIANMSPMWLLITSYMQLYSKFDWQLNHIAHPSQGILSGELDPLSLTLCLGVRVNPFLQCFPNHSCCSFSTSSLQNTADKVLLAMSWVKNAICTVGKCIHDGS